MIKVTTGDVNDIVFFTAFGKNRWNGAGLNIVDDLRDDTVDRLQPAEGR